MNLGRETFTRRTFRLSAWLLAVTVMVAGCSDEISSPPEADQGARLRITANVLPDPLLDGIAVGQCGLKLGQQILGHEQR